jgi:hypothetical protein
LFKYFVKIINFCLNLCLLVFEIWNFCIEVEIVFQFVYFICNFFYWICVCLCERFEMCLFWFVFMCAFTCVCFEMCVFTCAFWNVCLCVCVYLSSFWNSCKCVCFCLFIWLGLILMWCKLLTMVHLKWML